MGAGADDGGAFGRPAARLAVLALLGLWLGAMLFFGAAVAPAAFSALPTRQLAGAIVTATLGKLNVAGYLLAPLGLALLYGAEARSGRRRRGVLLSMALVALMGVLGAVSNEVVSASLESLRASMGVIDDVPPSDPRRVEFGRLHGVSVLLLGAQMICGLVALVVLGLSWMRGRGAGPAEP